MLLLAPTGAGSAAATGHVRNGLIAFQSQAEDGTTQVFTVRSDGHGLRQVTHGSAPATAPDWSPDGRWIAYASDECTIALVRADGSRQRTLASQTPDGCETDPAFTPDGRHLVFERYDATTGDDAIWVMDLRGGDRRRIATGPEGAATPEVSPDGRTLSFLSWLPDGRTAVFAAPMHGGGHVRQVTPALFGISYKHGWSPDGRRIVTSDNADDPTQPANVVTIRADGSDLRYLTHLTSADERAVAGGYSPDGKWVVYRYERGGGYALMVVRPDGHGAHALPLTSLRPGFIDWGPAAR